MNKVILLYRYDEYGDKQYLRTSDGYIFCAADCSVDINEAINTLGGGWSNGWELEIFYNPIQD